MDVFPKLLILLNSLNIFDCGISLVRHDLCDSVRQSLILEIFLDKKTVITSMNDRLRRPHTECMKLLPMIFYEGIDFIPNSRDASKSIMIDFNMTYGMVFYGNSSFMLENVFKKLRIFNPKTRLLFFLSDEASEPILAQFFSTAWLKFKLYDIYIVIDRQFEKYSEDFSIYSYHTFADRFEQKLVKIKVPPNSDKGVEELKRFKLDRHRNLHGYNLKVVLFQFMMVCEGVEDKNGSDKLETHKYQDAEALKILAKAANFTVNFVKSPDGVKHGYQTSKFTFTGSLGMVEYENADLSANARLLAEYNTTNTLVLFPTTTTVLKFTVPLKLWNDVNILVNLYNFLDKGLKLSVFALFLLMPLLFSFLDHISGQRLHSFDSLVYNYLLFHSIMTFVSIKLPQHWPSRYVIGSVVLVWLILGNTYAGKITEFMNTSFGLKQISSIEEMTEASLEVKVPYPFAILFEGDFNNATKSHMFINKVVKSARALESVGDRMAFIDTDNMGELIRSRKYALMFLDNLIEMLEKSYYDEAGNNILTHIAESPYEYYYAMSVPKTSPFANRFNEILMHIFEAGISKYQMTMAKITTDLIYIRRVKTGKTQSSDLKSISLGQLSSVFYFLLCSLTLSCSVMLCEVFINCKRKVRRLQ